MIATTKKVLVSKNVLLFFIFRFGTADKSVSAGKIDCSGCGARLHCHDPQMPGFIPVEILKGSKELNLRCQVMVIS